MLNFNFILLLATISNCIFAISSLNSENVEGHVDAGQVVSPDKADVKINWGPVWEDNEGINEFVTRNSEADAEEDTGNQSCSAPNGLGLQNLFQEVEKILPKEQITTIIKSYTEDPEIKAIKAFISNPQTQDKVIAIRNSNEYQILKDYSCRILHIDLDKYSKLARTLIKPLLTRTDTQPLKGIKGLINEITNVLPYKQLRDLYENLLASDDELVKAVANLKSKEYHQLLLNVRNNVPEYADLRQQLIAFGVPIEQMRLVLANALGWTPELTLFA